MIRRSGDAKTRHLVDERFAVKTKSRGGSSRPAQFPTTAFLNRRHAKAARPWSAKWQIQPLKTSFVGKFSLRACAPTGQDHTARNVVLQLSKVTRRQPWRTKFSESARASRPRFCD